MACPKCRCKETYQYDYNWDGLDSTEDMERCSACGHVFGIEESLSEDEDYKFEKKED